MSDVNLIPTDMCVNVHKCHMYERAKPYVLFDSRAFVCAKPETV